MRGADGDCVEAVRERVHAERLRRGAGPVGEVRDEARKVLAHLLFVGLLARGLLQRGLALLCQLLDIVERFAQRLHHNDQGRVEITQGVSN